MMKKEKKSLRIFSEHTMAESQSIDQASERSQGHDTTNKSKIQ